jgi:hypothetical protein
MFARSKTLACRPKSTSCRALGGHPGFIHRATVVNNEKGFRVSKLEEGSITCSSGCIMQRANDNLCPEPEHGFY